ncbi:hypothetical protein [Cellulomonas sp. KRMCY2]|uniref:hypothetical protein n=1 Tax=Cellulomonas sp. KRMCY2 TaxID=1304865 RepID=UPI001E62E024|nr:hypothetical protein [Cellulomonas sp. KRMCY2]
MPHVPTHVTTTAAATTPGGHRHRRRRRLYTVLTVLLVLALVATAGVGLHLYRTSQAWEDRSGTYLAEARHLGEEVAATRAELDGTQAELDAVRAQLTTAQDRIRSLADEKAQLRDDSEIQRQVVDYQERVTDAAGRVALALDECVQGQNQLIGYMENAAAYDPAELEQFGLDVQALCQAATEANTALQRELAR